MDIPTQVAVMVFLTLAGVLLLVHDGGDHPILNAVMSLCLVLAWISLYLHTR